MFKNYDDYKSQRDVLITSAQDLLNEGKMEEYTAACKSVTDLDNSFEKWCNEQANLLALQNSGASAPKLSNSTAIMTNNSDDLEYRKAFMNYMLHGTSIPEQFRNTDASTTTSEVAAVIPNTVLQKIIEKMSVYGKILARVTRTSYKGGVTVPTASAKPVASWVAERGTADTQEKTTGSITFAYRKLICKVSISLETSIVSLDVFEATVASNIAEAMVKALETAIISGTGAESNQPSGILGETPVDGQQIELAEGADPTYATLVSLEAAVPEGYDAGAIYCTRKKTYFTKIVGMVDSTGQPIARTNVGLDGKPEYTIFGRPVEFSDDVPAFAATVSADTCVLFIFNFADYMLNTNMEITTRKYIDEASDDIITKAIMLADGKVVDKNSLVKLVIKN